jgi:hypothetical protein
MNSDKKINILIQKIKKCEKINDDLYNYIYQEFSKWIDRKHVPKFLQVISLYMNINLFYFCISILKIKTS